MKAKKNATFARDEKYNNTKSLPLPCGGGLRVDSKTCDTKITQDGFDFAFNPAKCAECGGKCCIGESGYIFLTKDEMVKIAEFLGMDFNDFSAKFIRQVGNKYSLNEKPHPSGFACVFFDDEKQCSIYPVRPTQCQKFPFWDIFKNNKEGAFRECEGVMAKE